MNGPGRRSWVDTTTTACRPCSSSTRTPTRPASGGGTGRPSTTASSENEGQGGGGSGLFPQRQAASHANLASGDGAPAAPTLTATANPTSSYRPAARCRHPLELPGWERHVFSPGHALTSGNERPPTGTHGVAVADVERGRAPRPNRPLCRVHRPSAKQSTPVPKTRSAGFPTRFSQASATSFSSNEGIRVCGPVAFRDVGVQAGL